MRLRILYRTRRSQLSKANATSGVASFRDSLRSQLAPSSPCIVVLCTHVTHRAVLRVSCTLLYPTSNRNASNFQIHAARFELASRAKAKHMARDRCWRSPGCHAKVCVPANLFTTLRGARKLVTTLRLDSDTWTTGIRQII